VSCCQQKKSASVLDLAFLSFKLSVFLSFSKTIYCRASGWSTLASLLFYSFFCTYDPRLYNHSTVQPNRTLPRYRCRLHNIHLLFHCFVSSAGCVFSQSRHSLTPPLGMNSCLLFAHPFHAFVFLVYHQLVEYLPALHRIFVAIYYNMYGLF